MFRATKPYDGSDTSKCINLTPGDTLSSVHTLDETWFIGFNERSGEIGAFPIDCVEAIGNEYGPLPAKDSGGHKMDEKAIYANVSMHIQARKAAEAKSTDDIDPRERSRTLSTHAISFDNKKLIGTKPEKSFRLTLVKKDDDSGIKTDMTTSDPNDGKGQGLVRPEEMFSLKDGADTKYGEQQSVKFSEILLEHSISVADSIVSWQDSFEMSYEGHDQHKQSSNDNEERHVQKKSEDGKWHKLKRSSIQSSTDKLNRSDSANNISKILIGVAAGFVILALLYTILVFGFRYTYIAAGVVVGVSAIIMAVCIALSPLCRCVLVLLLPNMFAGKGRVVFFAILYGFLLSYPIRNITQNLVETGRSFTCLTELIENQSQALDGQLAQPFQDVASFIEKQGQQLREISGHITGTFDRVETHLDKFYESLAPIDAVLAEVAKACKVPYTNAVNDCSAKCLREDTIKNECLEDCGRMLKIAHKCDFIKDARKADEINSTATAVRYAIEGVDSYFSADIHAAGNFNTSVNSSNLVSAKHDTNHTGHIAREFTIVVDVLVKLLSSFLVLGFLQSFWYTRNYLSKEGFDNIYITEEFQTLDNTADPNDKVLPLKEREKKVYIDTSCCKLCLPEVAHCTHVVIQSLLYVMICSFVVLFEFSLYWVLSRINQGDGKYENSLQHPSIQVNVTGEGNLSEYYRLILKAINLEEYFTMSLNVTTCRPSTAAPSIEVIPVLVCVLLLTVACAVLHCYGMRLRRTIAAYYYPEQERARLEYLRKSIRLQRKVFLSSLSLQIHSSHREFIAKRKYSISLRLLNTLSRIERCIPALGKCIPKLTKLECSGCKQRERVSSATTLKKCRGEYGGTVCDAVYCEDCRQALNERCPICMKDETDMERY